MALPTTREELKDYCLRKLGYPVIEINVDNSQLEDRIDETIAYFQDFHFDGVKRVYLKHKITASTLETQSITGTFEQDEMFISSVTGIRGVFKGLDSTNIEFILAEPLYETTFAVGETITGLNSGATAVLGADISTLLTLGDIDQGSIPLPERVLSVIHLLPLPTWNASGGGMFNVRYQFALNNMHSLTSMNLISYQMFRNHMALLDEMFYGEKYLRHNRKMNRVYIDIDWAAELKIGDFVVVECMVALDPEEYKEVYSDMWVRLYCEQLFKLQWGSNLKKYSGMQLPGGITMDGQKIYDEAQAAIEKLEERIRKEFEVPPSFFVG